MESIRKYSLTDAGKKVLRSPTGSAFCAGHYEVAEVVNYTLPGKGIDGVTLSQVNFTYSPTDVPSWATSDTIKSTFPEFSKRLAAATAQPQKGRAELVLMSDGWKATIDNM